MNNCVQIAECKEPWIYWWALRNFRNECPADLMLITPAKIKEIWDREQIHPLQDYEWIELADLTFRGIDRFNDEQTREIWRQVYRIASQRI